MRGAGSGPALLPGRLWCWSCTQGGCRHGQTRCCQPCLCPCCLAVPSLARRFPLGAVEAECSRWACPCLKPVQMGMCLRVCVGQRHALSRESQASGVPLPWPWFLASISRFTVWYLWIHCVLLNKPLSNNLLFSPRPVLHPATVSFPVLCSESASTKDVYFRQRHLGRDFWVPLTNSSYLASAACILSKESIFHGHLAKERELAHVLRCRMDRQTPAAGQGSGWGSTFAALRVTAVLQNRRPQSAGGCVTGVGAGGSPSNTAAALSILTSLHAALLPPPPSTSLLQGRAAWPCVCLGPFLRRLPKQVVCWEVDLKKQAVTTGLSPGAERGADRELLRHCSCRYKFCYSPAFQCGFISKTGISVTFFESSCSPYPLKAFSS